jgi:hypothetical protein
VSSPSTSRRRFLAGLAGFGLAALAGGGLTFVLRRSARTRPGDVVVALLPHGRSAVAVGRAYLAARPQEADVERLASELELPADLPDLESQAGLATLVALAGSLSSRHRADFREGRVVELEGWVLSETELRLAALAALGDADGVDPRLVE